MITAINNAIPKLSISKELPIIESVNSNVTALITNKNNPSERTVTGNVKMIKIGLTITFKTDRTKLAPNAAQISSI